MKKTTLGVAALVLVAGLGATGCRPTAGTPTTGAAPASSATVSAEAELAAAASKLGEQSVRVDMKMGALMTGKGVMDPKARTGDMTMGMAAAGQSMEFQVRLLGQDLYMKIGGSLGKQLGQSLGGKWMHVDASKIKAGSSFDIMPEGDPGGAQRMIKALKNVERDGPNSFKGTLDMTKAPNADQKSLDALGAKATDVPFTAKTDDQGRLVELTVDMSALSPEVGTMEIRYSDFGTPVTVKAPPAADVAEMPAQLGGLIGA